MIELKFTNEQYQYLLDLFSWKDYNNYDYNKTKLRESMQQAYKSENTVIVKLAPEIAVNLLDFIDDKKTEYGFDDEYTVNEAGRKITLLWDMIYTQKQ